MYNASRNAEIVPDVGGTAGYASNGSAKSEPISTYTGIGLYIEFKDITLNLSTVILLYVFLITMFQYLLLGNVCRLHDCCSL